MQLNKPQASLGGRTYHLITDFLGCDYEEEGWY